MFLGVSLDIRRAPNLPFLEISAVVAKVDINNLESLYLQIAIKLVEVVQNCGGSIIPPFGEVPKDKNIFFTAQFESISSLEKFLKEVGVIDC